MTDRARTRLLTLASAMAVMLIAPILFAAEVPPPWAYPVNPPDLRSRPEDNVLRRVPDSKAAYSVTQLRDLFSAPVWHPDDHAELPEVVAHGRRPAVYACGFCHRADGSGGPENASLAGLPAAYIVRQLAEYRSGARKTSVLKRNIGLMISLSKDISDAEAQSAAAYFSSLKPRANIEVIETQIVPKTFVTGWFLAAVDTGEREPIAGRIIEVPADLEQFENRDARARFNAYVPEGSIAAGSWLVNSGGAGKTLQCTTCHGANLRGIGDVPSIAGRSPSYIVRQLYDIQTGARAGSAAQPMKATVARLTIDDMVSIAAYLASLSPSG